MSDKYAVLDPALMLREIDDQIDGNVFDQFSVLDLERARQQLADNGITVSNAAVLDPARFQTEVDAALNTGVGGGFVGPLDLTTAPALVAYGQRALSAAKLGSAAYTIRRDSDDTEQTFNSDVTTGEISVDDINTFLNGATGFGTSWADQSGNDYHGLQAGADNQPNWVAAFGGGSKPGFQFAVAGALQQFTTTSDVTIASGTFTAFAVCNKTGNTYGDELCGIGYDNDNDWFAFEFFKTGTNYKSYIDFRTSSTKRFFSRSTDASASSTALNTPIIYDAVYRDGSDYEVLVHGEPQLPITTVTVPSSPPIGTVSGPFNIGHDDTLENNINGTNEAFQGFIVELIIFDVALSNEDRAAIRQNMADYYGLVPLPQ